MSLKPNTEFAGKVCIRLNPIPSTQTYLKQLCSKSRPINGTAILSYNQTNGYGQRGAVWSVDPLKSIAVSLVFYPVQKKHEDLFVFNLAMALAVRTTLQTFVNQNVFLKWPNDVLVDEKKISGLLIESTITTETVSQLILGIGINVNQDIFPDELAHAVSLKILTGAEFNLDRVVEVLFKNINDYYSKWHDHQYDAIISTYNDHLFGRNHEIRLTKSNGKQTTAFLSGVNNHGRLIVNEDGLEVQYNPGEIKINYSG